MAQDNFFSGRPQIVEPLAWEESTTCFFLSLKDNYLTYFPAPTFTTEYLTMTTVNYFHLKSFIKIESSWLGEIRHQRREQSHFNHSSWKHSGERISFSPTQVLYMGTWWLARRWENLIYLAVTIILTHSKYVINNWYLKWN